MPKGFNFDQIKVLVTSECNSDCTHCFRKADKDKYILSRSKLIEIVDYAIKNSTNVISFSGGEFFTHPFAYDLMEYCFSKKVPIRVLTNAKELDLSFFENCEDLDLLTMQISIDGLKKNHDLRRGEGSFDATISNVTRLRELGIPITVKMTLDEHNFTDVVDVISMPHFTNYVILPVAVPNDLYFKGDHNPTTYEYYEKTIKLIYKKKINFMDKTQRCRMFPHGLAIRYDGNIYPCGDAREHDLFCMGNIINRSLHETIQDFVNSKSSKIISEYLSNDIQECNECSVENICNRGCRVRSYKFHGEFLAPDPFCCKILKDDYQDSPINCLFWGEK